MGFQQIRGIKVTPIGDANRHVPDKLAYWDKTGYAFGGWIYNTQLNIGYSQQPTTIDLDIALDAQETSPNAANQLNSTNGAQAGISFDIVSGDLSACYIPPAALGNFAQGAIAGENHYKISVGSNDYGPMFLTSYNIEGTSDSKLLKAKFVDYSLVLDKIYVGLFKRQGYDPRFIKRIQTTPVVDAVCPDCSLSGVDYWHVTGVFTGITEFATYFHNHYGSHDLLPLTTIVTQANVNKVVSYSNYFEARKNAHLWPPAAPLPTERNKFNINGGTLIIGCEEFNETSCGNLAPVTYNFSELILGLSKAGMQFSQVNSVNLSNNWNAHISGKIDKNPNYRQNYIGTLREVLNNWCGDFALDFYISGKTICFIDLASEAFSSVNSLKDSMIPANVALGQQFNSDKSFAIGNYTEKVDMSDTYEQKIITFDARPRSSEDRTKDIKNQCGFIAMHPLDFLGYNERPVTLGHKTIYGESFTSKYILNPIWDQNMYESLKSMPFKKDLKAEFGTLMSARPYFSSAGGCYRNHWYTTRPYILIDVCAALGKYSKPLRDIFLGGLIASKFKENEVPQSAFGGGLENIVFLGLELKALLSSFGFIPLVYLNELDYSEFKQSFIEQKFDKKTSDNRQNYILNSANFEIAIGFHTEENEKEIFEWEQTIAENMYQHGLLVGGNLKEEPFLTPDRTDQPSFFAGLTGISGLKVTKIHSETEPASEKYIDFFKLPFKDIYHTSGEYLNAGTETMNWSGMSIAKLDNEWGTLQEDFDQKLKDLSPRAECDNFKQGSFFQEDAYSSPAGFALEDFTPKFFEITDDLFDELEDELRNAVSNNPTAAILLGKIMEVKKEKKTQGAGTDPTYTQYKCPKLKLMVIPNVSSFQTLNKKILGRVGATAIDVDADLISELSPHLQVDFNFFGGKNPVMASNVNKMLEQRRIAKLKELPKNVCDTNLTTEICNLGKPIAGGKLSSRPPPALPYGVPDLITDCRVYSNSPAMPSVDDCKCVSEYTGEYSFGFESGRLINQDNCRAISITLNVNKASRINDYLPGDSLFSANSKGRVVVVPDDEDFPTFTEMPPVTLTIYYPVQSAPLPFSTAGNNGWLGGSVNTVPPTEAPFYHYYSGLLTTNLTVQVRSPEIVEVHGSYWSGISNVAKIEQINNEVQQDIQQQIDPTTKGFFKPVYDMLGNRISSVSGYHNLVTGMTLNSNTKPNLSLTFEVVGDAAEVQNFKDSLTPASGLVSFSYSLGQEGYRSSVSYSSRPRKLPNREALLNKIRPRL